MPFLEPFPRSFTATSVRSYAPTLSGVFGLSNAKCWVYIGTSDNIQNDLLLLLSDPTSSILRQHPTGFVFEVCDQNRRSARQDRLVHEYEPASNRRAPRP